MAEFTYEVKKKIGELSRKGDTSLELRLVSYNGAEPKYDIRTWKQEPTGERMFKGVTMTADELMALREILNDM